jgi:hypothetical protein
MYIVQCVRAAFKALRILFYRKVYPPNTIVHHQMGRGPYAPSITPFAMKLETYLRIAKVPFLVRISWNKYRISNSLQFSMI